MDKPVTDSESMAEQPASFDPPEDDGPRAYIVAVNDLFRVRDAESQEEAEQIVLDNLGEGSFEAYNAQVVDTEP